MTPSFTILLVDDDRDSLASRRAFLKTRRHAVLTAEAPDEALSLLGTAKPDITLLDLMMDPIDSGLRLGSQFGEAEGLQAWSGLDQFIDKPVTGKQLLKVVEDRAGAGRQ